MIWLGVLLSRFEKTVTSVSVSVSVSVSISIASRETASSRASDLAWIRHGSFCDSNCGLAARNGTDWQWLVAVLGALCLDAALCMQLRFDPIVASDAALLGRFLSTSGWPFHVEQSVDENWVRGRLESGHFFGSDSRSFWIRDVDEEPLGFARVFDLEDLTPLIDLRLATGERGRGVGTLALRGLTTWVFSEYPETGRLGGYTRHDNVAMRRVFEKCGFLQEAHHRRAWRVAGAAPVDAVGYAILRDEAEAL